MERRKSFSVAATLLLATQIATAGIATADDRTVSATFLADVAAVTPVPSLMLWDRVAAMIEGEGGMIVVEPATAEVVVARIESDGTKVIGCVDNAAAANAFLNTPQSKREQ
jgi:hypothetical protein